MNSASTISIAHSAPWPGARLASRVSSVRLIVTSQPQKKNNAVSAPVANNWGVKLPGHSHISENTCAGCVPYLASASTISASRIAVSVTVMAICE